MDSAEQQRIENLGVISEAIQKKVKGAWVAGFTAALRRYAYWKDGLEYVGNCGKTLKEALADLEAETKT